MGQSRFQFETYRNKLVMCSFDGSPKNFSGKPHVWRHRALFLLPFAYGGIHLTAWGYAFPSVADSLCWKASCLIITVCISLAGLVIK